jgi:hypothetical protein
MACCNKCPHCGKNIILGIYNKHVEICAQKNFPGQTALNAISAKH